MSILKNLAKKKKKKKSPEQSQGKESNEPHFLAYQTRFSLIFTSADKSYLKYPYLTYGIDHIQLLTFVEMDMKCYWTVNFILTDAKRRSIWIVYCSITLHVHRNKSKQLLYYIKIYSVEKSVIHAKFWLTFLHKPCVITTLCHRLCDISWSDITIHATLDCYVTNHATSSIVDLTWLAARPMKWLLFIDYIITSVVITLVV